MNVKSVGASVPWSEPGHGCRKINRVVLAPRSTITLNHNHPAMLQVTEVGRVSGTRRQVRPLLTQVLRLLQPESSPADTDYLDVVQQQPVDLDRGKSHHR